MIEDYDLPEGYTPPDYQKMSHNLDAYRTGDELGWINDMRLKNPEICRKYCELVISGMRAYDPSVDRGRIVQNCHYILAEMAVG